MPRSLFSGSRPQEHAAVVLKTTVAVAAAGVAVVVVAGVCAVVGTQCSKFLLKHCIESFELLYHACNR